MEVKTLNPCCKCKADHNNFIYQDAVTSQLAIDKNVFYQQFEEIEKTCGNETIIILGNFSARVGCSFENWPGILGKHGIGDMNENGQ
ncbi:hypothetical protein Y1Q_0004154 [Alligator mississippiensis]|uniref:Uncharacterized protein n=1 Tax=Alligator mississippiensis TaxID=8496 RepID=A0A151PIB8_ALLMI|nr:hypothetical protein Y1Q_0004154 [Alligator mississippiensis]